MEDRYRNTATAIVIILLMALAVLLLPMLTSSCHTHKAVSQEISQQQASKTVADSASETASRIHWLSNMSLDLDSFELFIFPAPYNAAPEDSCTRLANPAGRQHPQANVVALRGKHAVIGRADYVERDLTERTQQHTASSDSAAMTSQEYKDIDTTGIAKPPNMDWVIALAIITAAAVLLVFGYFKYLKR